MLSSVGNLNELDHKTNNLERQNFDLKMQIYYLNQKLKAYHEDPDRFNQEQVDEKSHSDIKILKDENTNFKNRINELEFHLDQMKCKDNSNISDCFAKISSKQQHSQQIEENRKSERHVSLLIAQQDATMIKKLEKEVCDHKLQQEKYLEIINANDAQISMLVKEKEHLKILLDEEVKISQKSLETINHLSEDILKQSDKFLKAEKKELEKRLEREKLDKESINQLYLEEVKKNEILQNRNAFLCDALGQFDELFADDKAAEQCLASPTHGTTLSGRRLSDKEVRALQEEHHRLQSDLREERMQSAAQLAALEKVRQSAEELGLLEAEEIGRLEAELDRCLEEKAALLQKHRLLEGTVDIYRQRIFSLETRAAPAGTPAALPAPPTAAPGEQRRSKLSGRPLGDREQQQLKTIDLYRQREAELLQALEGVVLRCQHLESRSGR